MVSWCEHTSKASEAGKVWVCLLNKMVGKVGKLLDLFEELVHVLPKRVGEFFSVPSQASLVNH